MDVTRIQGSDSPPVASDGRMRWPQRAEVSVLRRPGRRDGCEESTRRIETRGAGALLSRTTVIYYSNSHLARLCRTSRQLRKARFSGGLDRKLKQDPSRYCV